MLQWPPISRRDDELFDEAYVEDDSYDEVPEGQGASPGIGEGRFGEGDGDVEE